MQLEHEWKTMIESSDSGCIQVRGQWLVPEFQGVQLIKGKSTQQISDISRRAEVTDQDQLKSLVEAGAAQRQAFSQNLSGAIVPTPTQVPVVDSSTADQPQRPEPSDVLAKSISREVSFIIGYGSLSMDQVRTQPFVNFNYESEITHG